MIRTCISLVLFSGLMQAAFACEVPEGWLKLSSQPAAEYILWIKPDDDAYRQGRRFGADIIICKGDERVLLQEISIDATMPAHKHGTNYQPELAADINASLLRASGLFFHMPGEWQITVTLSPYAKPERHTMMLIVK